MVPPVLPKGRAVFILRKEVPEQDTVSLRRVLDAGPEGRTARIGPEIQQLEIAFVLLTKGNSWCAPRNRVHVELDRSVAERDVLEHGGAAVQSHQAAWEPRLAEELGVLLRLPAVGCHRDRDGCRARFGRDRMHRRE